MKKLRVLTISLVTVSFLVSCGGSTPIPKSTCVVTLDAGPGGKFFDDEQKFSFILKKETKLLPYIKQLLPTSDGQVFAYYEYEGKDDAIDYNDVVTSDITLKANYFDSTTTALDDLNELNWKTIKNIAVTGNPSQWFNIGATKKVKVNEKDYEVRIIDFNYDYTDIEHPDESRVGITFEFVNTIDGFTTYWNNKQESASTNYDFINNSNLNECLQPSGVVYGMIPSDLISVINAVNKKVDIHPQDNWEEGNYNTKLFPLSCDEVDGNDKNTYEYFKSDSQTKRIKDAAYWLRSPYTNNNNYAWYVLGDGNLIASYYIYYVNYAVAPAFCV